MDEQEIFKGVLTGFRDIESQEEKLAVMVPLLVAFKRELTEKELFEIADYIGVDITRPSTIAYLNLVVGASILELSDLDSSILIREDIPEFLRGKLDDELAIYKHNIEISAREMFERITREDNSTN